MIVIEISIYLFQEAGQEIRVDEGDRLEACPLRSLASRLPQRLTMAADSLESLAGAGWSPRLDGPALSFRKEGADSFAQVVEELNHLGIDLGMVTLNQVD